MLKLDVVAFIIFLSLGLAHAAITKRSPLKVAAFNIKGFGDAKMADVGNQISSILANFDVVLVQEVRDKDFSALDALKTLLGSDLWDYVSSSPIGRSPYYQEQYVFFYRKSSINVLGSFQYNDTLGDVFERDPFGLMIEYYSPAASHKVGVVVLGVHTQPENAVAELQVSV